MSKSDFLALAREFWGRTDLTLESDLVADVSCGDEDTALEFIEMLEERAGATIDVNLDKHFRKVWSMNSILSGIVPREILPRDNTRPLTLHDLFEAFRYR